MSSILDGRTLSQKIEDAKRLLLDNGYLVRGPLLKKSDVDTPAKLVRFFYDTLALYNPSFKTVYSGNLHRDRAIAKRLIESRIDVGSGKDRAISECCELITLLFQYEDKLGLGFPITSMGVLGQASMGWVTEKLWQLYEGVNYQVYQHEENEWWSALYKEQENNIDDDVIRKAKERMDRILERYGKNKKETSL